LEEIAYGDVFETLPASPAAKRAAFVACAGAQRRPDVKIDAPVRHR
jgi:hypothetical protein